MPQGRLSVRHADEHHCSDAVQWVGAMFNAYGVQLVDEKGDITVNSDATRTVLEWFKKTVPFFPPSVFAWDDASNNKALISGQSALIFNAPSAWAVAKRDAPKIAEQLWTFPTAERARRAGTSPAATAIGGSGISRPTRRRRRACCSICRRAMRSAKLLDGRPGLRRAALRKAQRFRQSGPRPSRPRARSTISRRAARSSCRSPATRRRPSIGVQMYSQGTMCKMIAQCTQQGRSIDEAIAFGESELEGYMRS